MCKDICKGISAEWSTQAEESCYTQLAVKNKDSSICKDISDAHLQNECHKNVALKAGNAALCDGITESPQVIELCKEEVAIRTGNADICDKIKDPAIRNVCYGTVAKNTGNKDVCEKLKADPISYEVCLMGVAQVNHDTDLCATITDAVKRDFCYAKIALQDLDTKACTLIADSNMRQMCAAELEILSGRFDCSPIESGKFREDCFNAKAAMESGDLGFCDNIKNQEFKDICIGKVAVMKGNLQACEDIENWALKEKCLSAIASKTGDMEVCNKIEYDLQREKCYAGIAASKGDASICEQLTYVPIRDKCFAAVAARLKDKSICDKISDPLFKNNCKEFMDDAPDDLPLLPQDDTPKGAYPCTLCANECNTSFDAQFISIDADYTSDYSRLRCNCAGQWGIDKYAYADAKDPKEIFGGKIYSNNAMIDRDPFYHKISESDSSLFYYQDQTPDIGKPGKYVGPKPVRLSGSEYAGNYYTTYTGLFTDASSAKTALSAMRSCAKKLPVQKPEEEKEEKTACDYCASMGWTERSATMKWQRNDIDFTDTGKYWSLSCSMGGQKQTDTVHLQIIVHDDPAKADWKIRDMVGREKTEVYLSPDEKQPIQVLEESDTKMVTLQDYTRLVNKPAGRMNWGLNAMWLSGGNKRMTYQSMYVEKSDAMDVKDKAQKCTELIAANSKPS